jgi:hypothetical protein
MQDAKSFLEHVVEEHAESSPDGCPHYEALVFGSDSDHDHGTHPSEHTLGPGG